MDGFEGHLGWQKICSKNNLREHQNPNHRLPCFFQEGMMRSEYSEFRILSDRLIHRSHSISVLYHQYPSVGLWLLGNALAKLIAKYSP